LNEADILKKIVEICEISVRNNLVMETRDYGSYNNTKTSTPISIHNCEVHQPTTGCIDESIINIGSAHSVQLSKNDIAELIPIGQFNNGFIICSKISEKVTEIFAIDQHAADERIRFEEIANSYSISCQKLVHPIKLNISSEDEDLILNNFDMIRSTGFLIRKFENSCYLDALPNFYGAETNIEGVIV
jgi:DNA mismatch repair ATPase MutL